MNFVSISYVIAIAYVHLILIVLSSLKISTVNEKKLIYFQISLTVAVYHQKNRLVLLQNYILDTTIVI